MSEDDKKKSMETVQLSASAIEAMMRLAGGDDGRFKELVASRHPEAGRATDDADREEVTLRLPRKSLEALDHLVKVSGRSRDEVIATLISQGVHKSL